MLKTRFSAHYPEAGLDEAGRGCLSGPVVAAAVILPKKFRRRNINDSKKLSKKCREELELYIKEYALEFAVAEVSPSLIDQHNILHASIHAMHLSLDQLKNIPELLLVDGNRFYPYSFIPHHCIIKGDEKFLSIACASILAKNHRDRLMLQLHEEFPQYFWNENMGYATRKHQQALREHGPCVHHRRSFRLEYHLPAEILLEK